MRLVTALLFTLGFAFTGRSLAYDSCLLNVTEVIEAESGFNEQYTAEDYDAYTGIDASGEMFSVENDPDDGEKPLQVEGNSSGLCVSGGVYNTEDGDEASWDDYHFGPAIYVTDSPEIILDNLVIEESGDGVAFIGGGRGVDGWTLRDSYIRHAGDDAVENDSKFMGLIDDVLIDWAYMGMSCRAGSNSFSREPAGTVTVQDTLIALRPQVGTFAGGPPEHLFVFKWDTQAGEEPCTLELQDTVLYLEQDRKVFDSLVDPSELVLECSNVTLVYAGSGSYSQENLDALEPLREKFPDSGCFDLLEGDEGLAFWQEQRDAWFERHADNPVFADYRELEPAGAE